MPDVCAFWKLVFYLLKSRKSSAKASSLSFWWQDRSKEMKWEKALDRDLTKSGIEWDLLRYLVLEDGWVRSSGRSTGTEP